MATQVINVVSAIMAGGCLVFALAVAYYCGAGPFLRACREWISIIERLGAILAALAEGWGIQWGTWCGEWIAVIERLGAILTPLATGWGIQEAAWRAQWFGFLEHLAAILAALATAAGIHWQQWRAAWWANVKGAATWRGNYD